MEKANVRLSGVIGLYLIVIVTLIGIVSIAAAFAFNGLTTVRADDTEKRVESWIDESKRNGEYDLALFPQKADYIVVENGKIISSEIRNGDPEKLKQFFSYSKEFGQGVFLDGQEVYRVDEIGESTIFTHYSVGVPSEWIVLGFIIVAYILSILVPSVVLINKLKTLIYRLAEEKWRKEYDTKQEMAQIAHDLKTPLTVIRGNAELLLENEQDESNRESVEAIVKNAERIAKSVLDILEK